MPVVVVTALRFLVIAIMQTAAWVAASHILEGLVDYLRETFKRNGAMNDKEVDDVLANEVIDTLALIGITVASLKTRIPIRLADKLGLKATTIGKRVLSQATKEKVAKTAASGVLGNSYIRKLLGVFGVSLVGSIPWMPGLVQQFGDQATFNAKNANNYYEDLFGFRPFREPSRLSSPGSFSEGEFVDYAAGLEATGIATLQNPGKGQTQLYSRAALAELVDYVYGVENRAGRPTTSTALKKAIAPYLTSHATPAQAAATSTAASASAAPQQTIKVFTGIVSSGSIKAPTEFSARPDDLIVSVGELETAAANNLAPYLAALPGKVRYEIKVVSSITTRDGFTQRGTTQRIQVGTYANGSPKYKTVTNKFAVMRLYIVTDTGTRHKLTDISLGPTDAVNFQPSANDISAVESYLQSSVHTSDTGLISSGSGSQSFASAEQGNSAAATGQASTHPTDRKITSPDYSGVIVAADTNFADIYRVVGNQLWHAYPYNDLYTEAEKQQLAGNASKFAGLRDRLMAIGIEPDRIARAQYITDYIVPAQKAGNEVGKSIWELFAAASTEQPTTATASPACSATNLSEFYRAMGQSLPGIEARSKTYEAAGLGAASYYVGTSEQNTKLLAALKLQNGCTA